MPFTIGVNVIKWTCKQYFLAVFQLESVDEFLFLDLGTLIDAKLEFHKCITITINKARGMLGGVKRWSQEFIDSSITKVLYTYLVRPTFKYGPIVRDPQLKIHIEKI